MDSQLRWIHQLLTAEQQFVLCLQFGIGRYLLPLAERKDVLKSKEHAALFQNVQEVHIHILYYLVLHLTKIYILDEMISFLFFFLLIRNYTELYRTDSQTFFSRVVE